VDFVLGEGGRVGERLADVFLLEVRELHDHLRRRHPVCDEVDDMRDRNPQTTDRRPPGEDGRVLRDAIERFFHNYLELYCSARDGLALPIDLRSHPGPQGLEPLEPHARGHGHRCRLLDH